MNVIVKRSKLWLILSIITSVFLVIAIAGTIAGNLYETVINVALGTQNYKIVRSGNNENTTYFESAFDGIDSLKEYEIALNEEVMGEGAVLLFNDNNALPLAQGDKVSTFSQSSARLVYGGTGSGYVDVSEAPNFRDALIDAGLSINETLWRFYVNGAGSDYIRSTPASTAGKTTDYEINEVPWSLYNSALKSTFASYGDAAIVVLSRSGGEGIDLAITDGRDSMDGDYLRLNQDELDLLTNLKAYKDDGTFSKIIVVLNTSNAIQLDFLQQDFGIDAAVWMGDPGFTGITAIAKILTGEINPSGRMVTSYLYDNHSTPAMVNFGAYDYSNVSEMSNIDKGEFNNNGIYVVYQEGIYVGYRYHETRYEDFVMNTGNAGTYDYHNDVAYTFGHGLSYTTFEYSNYSVDKVEGGFEMNVTVKNTGDVAGKHSVLAYMQSPYTTYDRDNNIEKSAVELVGFDKTAVLQPNASEDISIFIDEIELRTYDAYNAETYILDAGNYLFTVAESSHEAVNNFLANKGFTPDNTNDRMDNDGNASLVYTWNVPTIDIDKYSLSQYTGIAITNQFDNADINIYEGTSDQHITYLSRNNWVDTYPTETVSLSMTQKMRDDGLIITNELIESYKQAYMDYYGYTSETQYPTLNASNGMTLMMYKDVPYDAEIWNDLIDQLSFDDMQNVISQGFHLTQAVSSIGMPGTLNENGPQGLTASLVGGSSSMAFTSEDITAATFNIELAKQVGESMGEDCLYAGYTGMYAPGANIHRTAYSGRNFEYYSEDPFISNQMLESEISGITSKGVWVQVKHMVLNDQETGRFGISTWANEQAIREIYLEAMESIADSGPLVGVMSSYNRIGVVWSGSHLGLITQILRGEWNAEGIAITDCSTMAPYMDARLGVLAGSTLWDGSGPIATSTLFDEENDAIVAIAMKDSTKRIAYSVVNSNGVNGLSTTDKIVSVMPWWQTTLIAADVLFGVSAITFITFRIIAKKKNKVIV